MNETEHKWGSLNYKGDVTHMVGQKVGPSLDGKFFVATATEYDEDENKTKVEFDEVHA